MSKIKKILVSFSLKKILIFLLFLFIIFKISDGTEKIYSIIYNATFIYFILSLVFVFLLTISIIYSNYIIYSKYSINKISWGFFYYYFIKSQILSYLFSFIGVAYRYHIFKNKIKFTGFVYMNIFIIWFHLFFYLILYSFEILIFGHLFFPANIYFFLFLILLSYFIYFIPRLFKVIKLKNFINKLKNILIKYLTVKNKKIKIYDFYSYLTRKIVYMALLNHCISFFQFFFIFMMFNIPLSFNNIFLFFVLNSFLDQLPVITPKNIGISEIIFGYFAELSGASFDHGVLLKFFMRFSTLITLLILFFLLKFQRILLNICKSFKS